MQKLKTFTTQDKVIQAQRSIAIQISTIQQVVLCLEMQQKQTSQEYSAGTKLQKQAEVAVDILPKTVLYSVQDLCKPTF